MSPPLHLPPSSFSYRPALAPGSSAYKIKVRTAGIYKLDYAFFLARNIPVNDIAKLHVQNLGADVPVRVEENAPANNILEAGEALYFYGVPYIGEEGDWNQPSDLWQHGDYTDENIYWIFCGTTAGARMAVRSVSPVPAFPDAVRFNDSRTYEEQNSLYLPFTPVRNDDLWLWKHAHWYKGSAGEPVWADHQVTVPSVENTAAQATIDLTMRGVTSDDAVAPDHRVQISINGTAVGTPFTFDGKTPQTVTRVFPQNTLYRGSQLNSIRVDVTDPALLGLDPPWDAVATNRFTLHYSRLFEAYQNLLAFPVGTDAVKYPVTGFAASGVKGVDATNPAAPVWLTNIAVVYSGGTYKATLSRGINVPDTLTYLLAVAAAPASADVVEDSPSDLLASAAGKNWILVSPPQWTAHASVAALAALRSAQGYAPLVVSTEDIYDEFSYGLMSPLALRAFFDAAYHLSSPSALVGAVLLGDGTLDYKNNAGFGAQNIVPAFMVHDETGGTSLVPIAQYEWDNYYACVEGSDLIPDFYLGRVPAETSADVTNALTKILNFSAPADPTYQKGNIFVAGCRDGDQWEAYQDQNAALVTPAPPHTVTKMYYRGAPWNCTKTDTDGDGYFDFNEALTDAINAGQGIVSYVGHGSFDFWDDHSILAMADLPRMTNAARPALVLNADCYTSAFFYSFSNPAILESLITGPGGSAASGGPGGFMYNFQSGTMTRPFYETFYGMEKERLTGALFHAVIAEVEATGDARATKGYVELGDPLSAFALPTLGPPLNLQASVNCRTVSLTWAPPAAGGAASYRVFRAEAAQGPWSVLEQKALTPAYTDSTGTYGQTYFYRVTARDADGFEGKGSAAATATLAVCPPPAPDHVACRDPQLGGRLDISWSLLADPEVTGYTVHLGAAPGSYTSQVFAGLAPSIRLTVPADGTPYFMAVQATGSGGLLSPLSAEVSCTSTHALGWAPPRMVFPITLGKDPGGNPLLRWAVPALNIWGGASGAAGCSVYRGSSRNFLPDRSSGSPDRIGWVAASACPGGACAFADSAAPDPAYYYVTCETSRGEESSVEVPPPAPSSQVWVEWDGLLGCNYITWLSVTTDLAGAPIQVPHYRIFRGLASGFRPDVKNGSNQVGQAAIYYCDPPPDGQTYYYIVMAADSCGNTGPY